jgi:RNA polymerase-binding transcription factor DksA
MDKKTIEKYKKILEEKEKQITKDLEQIAEKNRHIKGDYKARFPRIGTHQDENANEIADYESLLSTEQNLEIDLAKIKKALEKIKKGAYGFCENCGRKIDQKRLYAFPEAELGIDCEKKKKK